MSRCLITLLSMLTMICAACPGQLDTNALFEENETNPLAFAAIDVYDREVGIGVPSEYVWVVIFSAENTSDAMQPITAEIAIQFHDQPALSFLTVVDLSSLAFYKKPFAAGAIREAGDRTIRRINRQLGERGLPAIENLHEHLFLVTDNNGEITQRYGVPDPNQVLTIIVLDSRGMELGRFDPQQDLSGVFDAINRGIERLAASSVVIETE